MHIPDGYLGPQTYVPAYAVMAGIWAWASRRVGHTLRLRQAPLLALGAAFSFVIMMFNVPIPGGTTGHAVGAVLIAILLGPWAAVIAVSLALIVQALLFGDGGITAIGANCLTMAVIMPLTGWWTYRLLAGRSPAASTRQLLAGAVGGYVGLNAAALATAVLLGIQPLIAHDAAGRALFCPFGLRIAVPVMALEHLLLFGFVEAAVTGMALAFVQRTDPSLLPAPAPAGRASIAVRLAIALGILALLTPLGLLLPAWLKAGGAWGEWGPGEIARKVAEETGRPGYVPREMERIGGWWKAPLPNYSFPGLENAPAWQVALAYLACGLIGAAALVLLALAVEKMLARRRRDDRASGMDASASPP